MFKKVKFILIGLFIATLIISPCAAENNMMISVYSPYNGATCEQYFNYIMGEYNYEQTHPQTFGSGVVHDPNLPDVFPVSPVNATIIMIPNVFSSLTTFPIVRVTGSYNGSVFSVDTLTTYTVFVTAENKSPKALELLPLDQLYNFCVEEKK